MDKPVDNGGTSEEQAKRSKKVPKQSLLRLNPELFSEVTSWFATLEQPRNLVFTCKTLQRILYDENFTCCLNVWYKIRRIGKIGKIIGPLSVSVRGVEVDPVYESKDSKVVSQKWLEIPTIIVKFCNVKVLKLQKCLHPSHFQGWRFQNVTYRGWQVIHLCWGNLLVRMKNLESLCVDESESKGMFVTSVSSVVKNMKSLKNIFLKLGSGGYCDLQQKDLTQLKATISFCAKQSFSIALSVYENNDLQDFLGIISKCTNVRELEIKRGYSTCRPFVDFSFRSLRTLKLSKMTGIKAKSFEELPELRTLELRNCKSITGACFSKMKNLKTLAVSFGTGKIFEHLEKILPQLERLDISLEGVNRKKTFLQELQKRYQKATLKCLIKVCCASFSRLEDFSCNHKNFLTHFTENSKDSHNQLGTRNKVRCKKCGYCSRCKKPNSANCFECQQCRQVFCQSCIKQCFEMDFEDVGNLSKTEIRRKNPHFLRCIGCYEDVKEKNCENCSKLQAISCLTNCLDCKQEVCCGCMKKFGRTKSLHCKCDTKIGRFSCSNCFLQFMAACFKCNSCGSNCHNDCLKMRNPKEDSVYGDFKVQCSVCKNFSAAGVFNHEECVQFCNLCNLGQCSKCYTHQMSMHVCQECEEVVFYCDTCIQKHQGSLWFSSTSCASCTTELTRCRKCFEKGGTFCPKYRNLSGDQCCETCKVVYQRSVSQPFLSFLNCGLP